jgi:hypothetical protein
MAGEAQQAVGVEDARLAAGAVVLDELELEAPLLLVVADHFEDCRALLVANVEPILEQERGSVGRLAVNGGDDTRKGEVVGSGRRTLQRATERNEDTLQRRQ